MDAASNSSGFSSHVMDQLHQMSHQATARGRGNRGRGRGRARPTSAWHQQQQSYEDLPPRLYENSTPQPFDAFAESFPPLGSQLPPAPRSVAEHHPQPLHRPALPQTNPDVPRRVTPREYHDLARGNHRGGRQHYPQNHRQHQFPQQSSQSANPAEFSGSARPPPRHGQLYNPNAAMRYASPQQQRAMRHLIIKQADCLTGIAQKAYDVYKFTGEEASVKENFRLGLEKVARDALAAHYPELGSSQVTLKCYGSLANGFALKDCDMDLLLSLPGCGAQDTERSNIPESANDALVANANGEDSFKADVQRILEKAFLEHEYGARLLTRTRVPILRICQSPSPELLENLRKERADWEQSIDHTGVAQVVAKDVENVSAELEAVEEAVTELTLDTHPARVKRGGRGNAGLEFTDDCGIQCDINFSNFVALHNSTLLRLYHNFDSRVKYIGVFVKIWAKIRDINTPYRGTLSSYGWILMVLHYLMNVANPPVIPNLQQLAKVDDTWNPDKKIELFEGFDVRFVQDPEILRELKKDFAVNKNRESAGQLLRGFFQYYGTHQGFHWTRDALSLRTKGGIISKQSKGWTEAKWQQGQNKQVRNRYQVAIEDPFETEHNIGRTVGYHGVIAIRDEFRRAWAFIEKIGTEDELPADEFLQPVTERIDTLGKDLESRRQKQIQMREEMESRERALLRRGDAENVGPSTDGMWGDSDLRNAQASSSPKDYCDLSESKLTSTPPGQDHKHSRTSQGWRRRRVRHDSDDDGDSLCEKVASKQETDCPPGPTTGNGTKRHSEGLTSRAEVLLANGYDHNGNLVSWDNDTYEGRWLQYRDDKVRKGDLVHFHSESVRDLDEQCPYDERRSAPPADQPRLNRFEQGALDRPPWPSNTSASRHSQPGKEIDTGARKTRRPLRWDPHTKGGRWLFGRDRHILKGTFVLPEPGDLRRLHEAFPFNPEITNAELEEMNGLLRRHHRYSIHSRNRYSTQSVQDAIRPSSNAPHEEASSFCADQYARTDIDDSKTQDLAAKDSVVTPPAVTLHQSPPLAFSSSIRKDQGAGPVTWSDGHPSQDTVSEAGPTTPGEVHTPDAYFLRMQRLAYFTKASEPQTEIDSSDQCFAHTARSDSADAHNQRFQTSVATLPETALLGAHRVALSEALSQAGEAGSSDDSTTNPLCQSGDNTFSPGMELSDTPVEDEITIQVPPTLYPGVGSSERPPDEDPNVMPIPRTLGFRFDPRQMQDLAIISKGGNGCAREGAEFNIEGDGYEWAGGGRMGYKTSTGPQIDGASGGHTPYEAGHGDQEGLLDELPRHWATQTVTSSC